jgi:hypothetical protein
MQASGASRAAGMQVCVIARSESDDPSSLAARATRGVSPPKHPCAKAEAIQGKGGLDRFAEPVIGRAFARPVGSP